jgi:hypothetical protein
MYNSEFEEEYDSDEENLDGIKTLEAEGHPEGLFKRALPFGTIMFSSIKSELVKDLVKVLPLAYETDQVRKNTMEETEEFPKVKGNQ